MNNRETIICPFTASFYIDNKIFARFDPKSLALLKRLSPCRPTSSQCTNNTRVMTSIKARQQQSADAFQMVCRSLNKSTPAHAIAGANHGRACLRMITKSYWEMQQILF